MSSMDTEVVVVGGGPSGLVLGLFLAQYEVKVSLDSQINEQTMAENLVTLNLLSRLS